MSDFILPEELMMNIWLTLPIKSTVRFRCVSKSWCASLADPQFIYKNLTFLGDEKDDHDLLLVLDRNDQFYSVFSHETLAGTPATNFLSPLQVSPLREVPGEDPCNRFVLTYSCDDLVCFHRNNGMGIGVWNLTTGETKMLPSVSDDDYSRFIAPGFGFDDKTKDYKIVQIRRSDCYTVYVYTLYTGNNCWRKLDKPNLAERALGDPYERCCSYSDDGIFYWCDSTDGTVSFDMSSEAFSTISIPQTHPLESIKTFCKLKNGSMLVVSHSFDNPFNEEHELWAWLEVGVTPFLTRLFRIDWHNVAVLQPFGLWRNELVFGSSKRVRIGDPSSQRETKVIEYDEPVYGITCCFVTKGKNSVPLN